jgi:hypothetical protein
MARKQRGGAFGIDVGHPLQTASGAPLEARAVLPDGAELARPAPSTYGVGGVLRGGRRSRRQRSRRSLRQRSRRSLRQRSRRSLRQRSRRSLRQRSRRTLRQRSRQSRRSLRQRGGACGCAGIQRGGGSGTGGFGFTLNNDLGKVYADLPRGSCTLPQRGGAAVGASESSGQIVSTPAGFGYAPASVFESKDGSAHFLDQIAYGKHQAGGRRRAH